MNGTFLVGEASLVLHILQFAASKGTQDCLCYPLFMVLVLIISIFGGTLWSLSAFLTGIVMNQHLPVQNSCLFPDLLIQGF